MAVNDSPIPLQIAESSNISPSNSCSNVKIQSTSKSVSDVMISKEMLAFQKLNRCQRKASLCCGRIKNRETNKCNYCNLVFGLILIVIIVLIDSYVWNTSNQNPFNVMNLSLNTPIQLFMIIVYEVMLDFGVIYIAMYLAFISVYFTKWFGNDYPSKYFDDKLLSLISNTEKCFYWFAIIKTAVFEIAGILLMLFPFIMNPRFDRAIFLLFRAYAWHSALSFAFIEYKALLYGTVSIKRILLKLNGNAPTVSILSDCYGMYKRYHLTYRNIYKPIEFAVGLLAVRIVSGFWLSFDQVLSVNISSAGAAMLIYNIVTIIPFIYFLCEQTKQFHKLEDRINNIFLEITEKKLGTQCYLECAGFEKLLKIKKYNGRIFGYELSYKALFVSFIYFLIVRFIAYSIEKQNL